MMPYSLNTNTFKSVSVLRRFHGTIWMMSLIVIVVPDRVNRGVILLN